MIHSIPFLRCGDQHPASSILIRILFLVLRMVALVCAAGKGNVRSEMAGKSGLDVLFLDMDGVLLPFGGEENVKLPGRGLFPDCTLHALSLILVEQPTVVLVLSSTWRVKEAYCSEIVENFRAYGRLHGGPLADVEKFHDVTDISNHTERQWEIQEWLSLPNNSVRAWVAIDDEELIEGDSNSRYRDEFEGHVIKTNSEVGLTESDARQAIALLKEQVEGDEAPR